MDNVALPTGKLWLNSKMETFYSDDSEYSDLPCAVRIGDGRIRVSYEDEGEVVYVGEETGDGHYHLRCPEEDGEATLHCFPGAKVLDGWWKENGAFGMWRVRLAD